ncbi:L,D-transpeptidase family protein [Parerythrobacter aurantius]|uniref:L,D-transpeptidase family protein n=1 Tax=Parerythrobacter aurantius TaxID=3127706 RepID=UPI0032505F66
MNPMIKWIGGATAAAVFVLGGATLASSMMGGETKPVAKASLEEAIPVDPAKVAGSAKPASAAQTPAAAKPDDGFVVKRILPIEGPIKYGEWFWDDKDVPSGPIVMTVDLQARVISVFKGGYEIGTAAVLLGTDEHPTPLGVHPILYKQKDNVSEKYGNAPMPYSMFLTTDGVALHGADVELGFASHGCVGLPTDFAAKIFAVASKGDKVIITDGETMGMGDKII